MMMNNIFEDAKFGDKFLTKDGEIVILLRTFKSNGIWHYVSNGITEYSVNDNGKVNKIYFPNGVDIVSRYQKSSNIVDEEKLDELAYTLVPIFTVESFESWYEGFKAGYRKAMEG